MWDDLTSQDLNRLVRAMRRRHGYGEWFSWEDLRTWIRDNPEDVCEAAIAERARDMETTELAQRVYARTWKETMRKLGCKEVVGIVIQDEEMLPKKKPRTEMQRMADFFFGRRRR